MDGITLLFGAAVVLVVMSAAFAIMICQLEPPEEHPDVKNIQWPVTPTDSAQIECRSGEDDQFR